MLTVLCILWGDWPMGEEYVARLAAGVKRHLTTPYRFVCMTDWANLSIDGVETFPLAVPNFKRNLRKMAAYQIGNGLEGQCLLIDLDNVITGSLDDIAAYDGEFAVLEDLFDGNGMCGGGVISFRAQNEKLADLLYNAVAADPDGAARNSAGGSERHWFRRQFAQSGIQPDFWQGILPGQVVSAKPERHVVEDIPEDARIVCFHGRQKPHLYTHLKWVEEHWRLYD